MKLKRKTATAVKQTSALCMEIVKMKALYTKHAEVITSDTKETYIGLCDTTCFKLRYRNHVCSFKNEQYRHVTELSKYIWNLKDKNIKYDIKWRKVKHARPYTNVYNKRCNLCLCKKYFIICKSNMAALNKRSELMAFCRHSKKFLLSTSIT